jgi:hypothetical protein
MTQEELEDKIKALEEKLAKYEENKEATSSDPKVIDGRIKELEVTVAQNKALGEYNQMYQAQIKLRKELEKVQAASTAASAKITELEEKQAQQGLTADEEKLLRVSRLKVAQSNAYEQRKNELQGITDLEDENSAAQEKRLKKARGFYEDIAVKIGLNSRAANGFINKMTEMGKMSKQEKAQAFKDTFSFKRMGAALAMSVLTQTMKLTMAVDKATAAFAAQTGAGRALTEEIMAIGGGYRNLGIGAEDAGKAAQALFSDFTGFMQTSQAGRKDLMLTVASLEKIGVSGQTASKSLQIMSSNFGLSTRQASKMTKQLSVAGTKIGISASKMLDGFVAASKSLAVYGKDSIKVFTDLAAQAKAAGTEVSSLMAISGQFDKFDTAADTIGKLNSILGTQMSAIDMVRMSDEKRIEALISSVQAQGMAFADMDKYSQMAVANAAGITDMAEAQRIFGMSVNDYRKGLKEAASEEEFNNRLKDAMDVFKKLEMAMKNFAIQIAPLVNWIAWAAQGLLDLSQAAGGVPAMIIAIVAAGYILMAFLPGLIGLIPALTGAIFAALPALGTIGTVIGVVLVAALAALSIGIATLNLKKLQALGSIFSGLAKIGEVKVAKNVILDTADVLVDNQATLRPILGDMALISTGATTQSITRATTSTAISQFAANFENVFKPNVIVKIGDETITDKIATIVDNKAVDTGAA